jgi:hypothetical protein
MNNHMIQDYSELLKALDERASVARSEGTGTALGDALHFEQAATAIRALVAENERLELALQTIVELPISDGSQDDMLAANMRSIARAALGETK